MAQVVTPTSTQSSGAWTASPSGTLHEATDTSADSVFAQSSDNTSPDAMEVHLGNPADPGIHTGHVVTVRIRKEATGGHELNPTIELYQGTTQIATRTLTAFDEATWQEEPLTLSPTEASNITDYTDLRVRVSRIGETGGGPSGRRYIDVDYIQLSVPDVTVSNPTASGTGTAVRDQVDLTIIPSAAAETGTAVSPTVDLALNITNPTATGTGTAINPTVLVDITVAGPTATGTATVVYGAVNFDIIPTTTGGTSSLSELVNLTILPQTSGTGTAINPTVDTSTPAVPESEIKHRAWEALPIPVRTPVAEIAVPALKGW